MEELESHSDEKDSSVPRSGHLQKSQLTKDQPPKLQSPSFTPLFALSCPHTYPG